MKKIHEREKEQFKKLFEQEGIDDFENRFHVLEVFLQTEQHITASDLVALLKEQGYDLSAAFVRETLALLGRFGFASKHRFEDGKVRYEHRHLGDHHDHMICMKCGSIVEFADDQLEKLQAEVAAAQGFLMLQHKMEIYGICAECLKEREFVVPLVRARQGETVEIASFTGGSNAHLRLLSMGLKVGDRLEIVTSDSRGELVVALDQKRYALGRGLAGKIQVKRVQSSPR